MIKLYTMKLHEMLDLKDVAVLRVPGGWIYFTGGLLSVASATFVPFHNEFQND